MINQPYGRRLINENQVPLLNNYKYVVWGVFSRSNQTIWYPLG